MEQLSDSQEQSSFTEQTESADDNQGSCASPDANQHNNDQLYEKALDSFWQEKHGLLEPPLANRIREASIGYLKTGSKKLLTAFGAATVLAGAAYLGKDQVVENIDNIMKSPVVTESLETHWNKPLLIDGKDQLSGDQVSLKTTDLINDNSNLDDEETYNKFKFTPDAVINLDGTTIELKSYAALQFPYTDRRHLKDTGEKIDLKDRYLQNLTRGSNIYLHPAANPEKFAGFIKTSTDKYFNRDAEMFDDKEQQMKENGRMAFDQGSVGELLKTANNIVQENLNYDKRTARWLEPGQNGRFTLKWGGNNPITAFASSDNMAIDELLMDKKEGVCRHYAEALSMVCEEIKKQNPDKFQNVYILPLADAYQMHEYNVVYVVTGEHSAQMFTFDPTENKDKGSPSFDLFKTLYRRNIIDESMYIRLSEEYFQNGGMESQEDAMEYVNWAFAQKSEESIASCKPILSRIIGRAKEFCSDRLIPEKDRAEGWKEFQDSIWPYIVDYKNSTGEDLYYKY